jgi:hypothetical protein
MSGGRLSVPFLPGMNAAGHNDLPCFFKKTYDETSAVREQSLGYPGYAMESGVPEALRRLGSICIGAYCWIADCA